jgi:hypothetical protein
MKKIILLVVLFLVVGIATFGQTAFIRDKDGSIKKVLVQALPKVDTLCIIEQDLSTIPGTAEQQLWALENPGMDTMVYKEEDILTYSKFGLRAYDHDHEMWIVSDGPKLNFYSNLVPKGDRPAWELCYLLGWMLFTSYLFGRFKKLMKSYNVMSLALLSLMLFVLGFIYILCGGFFAFVIVFVIIAILLMLIIFRQFNIPKSSDIKFVNASAWWIIVPVYGCLMAIYFKLWGVVVFCVVLSVVGYLLGYYTTKKKTLPELQAVKTNE